MADDNDERSPNGVISTAAHIRAEVAARTRLQLQKAKEGEIQPQSLQAPTLEVSQDKTLLPDLTRHTRNHPENAQPKQSELCAADILAAAISAAQIDTGKENEPEIVEESLNENSHNKTRTASHTMTENSANPTPKSPPKSHPDFHTGSNKHAHQSPRTAVQEPPLTPTEENDTQEKETEIVIPMIPTANSFAELAENSQFLSPDATSTHMNGSKTTRPPNKRGSATAQLSHSSPKANTTDEMREPKRQAAAGADGIFTILLKPTGGGQLTESNRVRIAKGLVLASGRKALQTRVNTRLNIATVTTRDQDTADALLATTKLAGIEVNARTPPVVGKSRGVITRLPPSEPTDEIMSGLDSTIAIVNVQRFNRGRCARLHFDGERPTHVLLWGLTFMVEDERINPLQCFGCGRFGHIRAACTFLSGCPTCRGRHPRGTCTRADCPKCPNCALLHDAFDHRCPAFQKAKQVATLIVNTGCSAKEALETVNAKETTHLPGSRSSTIRNDDRPQEPPASRWRAKKVWEANPDEFPPMPPRPAAGKETNTPLKVTGQGSLKSLTSQPSVEILTTDQKAQYGQTRKDTLEQQENHAAYMGVNDAETTGVHVEQETAKQQKSKTVYKRTYTHSQPQRQVAPKHKKRALGSETTESSSQTELSGEDNINHHRTNDSSGISQNASTEQAGSSAGTSSPALSRPPSGRNDKHETILGTAGHLTPTPKQTSSSASTEPLGILSEITPTHATPADVMCATPASMLKALIKVVLDTTSAMMKYIVDLPEAEDIAHLLHRLGTTLTTTSTEATAHAAKP